MKTAEAHNAPLMGKIEPAHPSYTTIVVDARSDVEKAMGKEYRTSLNEFLMWIIDSSVDQQKDSLGQMIELFLKYKRGQKP
jgi:hypothetical protein